MVKPSIPSNEAQRLAALREYQILDTEAEKEFEELTLLASEICQTPISLVTLIDEKRQWFKAGSHLPANEISRDIAFCSHAINQPFEPFIVPDMRTDERFSDHPFVTGEPHVVFYTGIPLTNPEGFALGTLCVLDVQPKKLSDNQIKSLQILAKQVMQLLELRKANIRLKSLKEDLESRNNELQQFAYVVSHDIKSPLSSIVLTGEMLREGFGDTIDESNDQLLKVLTRSTFKIKNLVDGILAYYRAEKAMSESAEYFAFKPFLESIVEMVQTRGSAEINIPDGNTKLFLNKTALEQILVNLIQNALKYNDKSCPVVDVIFSEDDVNYYFVIKDNGNGIAESEQKQIFELFTTLRSPDRFGMHGTGIGLSTVKNLIEKMNGRIELSSAPGSGSAFAFSLKKINPGIS